MVSPEDWAQRMARGEVLDDRAQPLPPSAPYRPGTRVFYYRHWARPERPVPGAARVDVVHQDDWIVVADKPPFLPVTPGGRYVQETLLVKLRRQLGLDTLAPAHRIDRETQGLVLFSVQPATRNAYQAMFRERRVHKVYEAVAPWRPGWCEPTEVANRLVEPPGTDFMQMQVHPGPPNAFTRIERVACAGPRALYRLHPLTGQKHQLRVHMAGLGLPIEHDTVYPVLQAPLGPDEDPDPDRALQLLARRLAFTDPVTGQPRVFESRRRLPGWGALAG